MGKEIDLKKQSQIALRIHSDMLKLHIRAIACHCETMGMMSENMLSAVSGAKPQFVDKEFKDSMCSWGLIDDKGNPII